MRLIACHVDNFGKLSNVNINFNEGINIKNEPNGWGKSTLAAFLKAMLYGFDNKKEPGAFEKERKIYQPWQGGTYGGELDFEIDHKKYRISRTFGSTEKTDEFHLYNLDTNLECDDYSSNIGEEIFDIDRASFKRSIFIAQNDCASGTSDSINAKLGNLAENTNDINNFESALEVIKDMMNKLSPNRITGSIKKRRNTITQLEHEIKGYDAAELAVADISSKLEEKRNQKVELQNIRQDYARALKVASEDSRRLELKKNYEALCSDVEESEKQYEEIRRQLPSEIPSEEVLDEYMGKARKLEECIIISNNLELSDSQKEKFEELQMRLGENGPSDAQIDDMLFKANNTAKVKGEHAQLEMKLSQMESVAMLTDVDGELSTKPKKSSLIPGGIAMMIIGIISGLLAFTFSLETKQSATELIMLVVGGMGIFLAIAGIVCIVIGYQRNGKAARELLRKLEEREQQKRAKEEPILELKEQLETIESGISMLDDELKRFLKKYKIEYKEEHVQPLLYGLKSDAAEYRRLKEQLAKAKEADARCRALQDEIRKFGLGFGIRFDGEIISEINRIQAKNTEAKLSKKTVESAKEKKRLFEEQHEIKAILASAECPYTLEELNNMIREVDNRIEEVQESLEQYTRQLEDMQEQLDMRDEKEQVLRNCENLQVEEQHKFDILNLTSDFLQKSKEQFTARYMAPIADGFQKYYGILTGDESRNWMVDANISLKMKEQGEYRDVKWLSAGYRDLIGVCMRFALVDAMYPTEKPFLILDDPFVNLDDEKLSHGKQLLIALEKEYQAIYFTCHESREYQ